MAQIYWKGELMDQPRRGPGRPRLEERQDQISIRLPRDVLADLDAAVERRHRDGDRVLRSAILREAIVRGLRGM